MGDTVIHIDIHKQIHTADGEIDLSVKTDIPSGELVALFGPSGAGKTTLLRILSGLTVPDQGKIECGGRVWFDSGRKINVPPQQRNIGYMFQDYALFPNMTVLENILFAQRAKDVKAADDLLSVFGLNEFRMRKPGKLSGGQKQRVALARALACEPQLLLLDEPLSSVDAQMRMALQDEISRVHRHLETTILMVSHDLEEVFRLASLVIQIENGIIKKSGVPELVFSDVQVGGKVQIAGRIVRIDRQEPANIVTVTSANNQIIEVVASDRDLDALNLGDQVMVFTKAFNPVISKLC